MTEKIKQIIEFGDRYHYDEKDTLDLVALAAPAARSYVLERCKHHSVSTRLKMLRFITGVK